MWTFLKILSNFVCFRLPLGTVPSKALIKLISLKSLNDYDVVPFGTMVVPVNVSPLVALELEKQHYCIEIFHLVDDDADSPVLWLSATSTRANIGQNNT